MTDSRIYGLHAVAALLSQEKRRIKGLYYNLERRDARINEILAEAQRRGVTLHPLNAKTMNSRFPDLVHQGLVALAEGLRNYDESDLAAFLAPSSKAKRILILDGVTDPHNLGAILRTADATGVDFLLIPKDNNASITEVVSKVACGAAETVPVIRVTNLARAMVLLKEQGIWIYGAAGEATQALYQIDFKSDTALVLGAEGKGMRRLTKDHCDGLFSIPMQGSVSSLNVSVAAGVCLYEALRQNL